MSILKNFRTAVTAREKKHFTFFPDELITTPQEFTDALIVYAKNGKRDLTITREGLSPDFILDGVEYNATRMTSIYGSFVVANALNPELLDDPDIPKPKLKRMEIVWRFVVPTCFWVGMALLFLLPIFGNYLSQL